LTTNFLEKSLIKNWRDGVVKRRNACSTAISVILCILTVFIYL